MELTLEELKKTIAARRREIWEEEPEEIRVLKRTEFPNSKTFASVMYAYAEIYQLTKNLYLFRNALAEGQVALGEGLKLLSLYLNGASQRYNTWKLVESSRLVAEVAGAIQEADDVDMVKDLLDELLIYNNKIYVWLDSSIPWFKLGRKISFD